MASLRSLVVAAATLVLGSVAAGAGCSSSSSSSSPSGGTLSCSDICAHLTAAHCPNDGDCATQCTQLEAMAQANCTSAEQTYLKCAITASISCDTEGESEVAGCDAQEATFDSCLSQVVVDGGMPIGMGMTTPETDAGSGPGTSACGQTTATSGVALCGACSNLYCCPEIQACQGSADCPTLQTCLLRCTATDQACNAACRNLYPDATAPYDNLTNCASLACAQACSTPPDGCSNPPLGSPDPCQPTGLPLDWDCPSGPPQEQVPCVASPDGTPDRYCCLQ